MNSGEYSTGEERTLKGVVASDIKRDGMVERKIS